MERSFLSQFKNKIFIRVLTVVIVFSSVVFFVFSLAATKSFEKVLTKHLDEMEEYSEDAEFLKETRFVFYNELNRLKRNSVFAFGGSLLLAAFASYFISFRLTKNFNALIKFVNNAAYGNLNATIKINSGDEFETVADSFNNILSVIKSNQTELSNQKTAIESIVMNLEDGIVLFNESGKINIVNKSAEYILNEKEKDILNKNVKDFSPSSHMTRLYEIMGKAVQSGVINDILTVWRGGEKIKYAIKATPSVDKEGRFWGFAVIIKKNPV